MNGSVFVVISHFLYFSTGDHNCQNCIHQHLYTNLSYLPLPQYSPCSQLSKSSPGAWCAPCVVSGSAAPVPLSTQVGGEKISTSDLKLLFLSPLSIPALDLRSMQSTEVSYLSLMTENCNIYNYGSFVIVVAPFDAAN